MKDLKTSLDKFNSSIEKLNSVIVSRSNDNSIDNKKVEEILLKENESLKFKYADTLNKLEKILIKINTLEKKWKKMPEVNIIINNREHKIACSAGEEERVKELASLLNNEVISIADSLGQIGDVKLMVLAAITILDKNQDTIEDAIKIINNSTKKIEKIYNKIENNT